MGKWEGIDSKEDDGWKVSAGKEELAEIATTDSEGFTIAHIPKLYVWKPRKDITAYELALAMPVLVSHCYGIEQMMKDWPETVQRHFEEA